MNQFLDIGIPTAAQAASKVMRMGPNGPVPEFPMYAPAPQAASTPQATPNPMMSPLQAFARGGQAAPLEKIAKEVSQSKAPGSAIQDWAKKLQERGQKISLIPDLVTPGSGNLEGESEQVQTLSSLLQQNQFSEAFNYAQENNLHRYLLDHNKLKDLRTPFTRQEAEEFMYAAPKEFFVSAGELANKQTGRTTSRSFDELYNFDPKKAIESLGALAWVQPGEGGWSMSETGYPLLGRALEPKELKKEPNWFDKLIKGVVTAGTAAALAYAGGTALLGSSGAAGGAGAAGTAGAGGAGAAGTAAGAGAAAGTGGGALAGIQTAARTVLGIPQLIGEKVATALGAEAIGATGAKMIGNAVISGGITGAKGGDFEDVLKSAALAAGFTFVSDKAIQAVADQLQATGITDAVKDLPVGGDATAAASSAAQNAASRIADGLQEVVVTGSQFGDIAGGIGGAAALSKAQDVIRQSPAPDIEMPPDELEEVIVQSLREAPPRNIQDLLANLGTAGTQDILSEREIAEMQEAEQRMIDEQAAPEDIEEFTVETGRPITDYLNVPPFDLVDIPDATDVLRETPAPEVNYPDDMEEVIIETDRPGTDFLDVPPVDLVDFPDPTDIMKESPAPEINYPEKGPLEKLFDKYGTLENLIKLVGMVGAGKGSTGAAAAPAPAYDPRASAAGGQWIDWEKVKADAAAAGQNLNTYVARNWNKIQNRALEAGMAQPTAPGYNMPTAPDLMQPGSEPTMSTQAIIPATVDGVEGYYTDGSMTNFVPYAEGGMSRRVRGPGSGREDLIPALLSDGEYVIDAETMALLGDGSVEKAADLMDDFREKIRKHKGAKLAKGGISPNAKSPLQYLMGK